MQQKDLNPKKAARKPPSPTGGFAKHPTRAIQFHRRTIRLSSTVYEKLSKIKKASQYLSQEKGEIVTIKKIAEHCQEKPEEVLLVLKAAQTPNSLDWELQEELTLLDSVQDKSSFPHGPTSRAREATTNCRAFSGS